MEIGKTKQRKTLLPVSSERSAGILAAIAACVAVLAAATATAGQFDFAILGDRTGGAQPGVYEQVWKEATEKRPSFLIACGDSIEGEDDATAASQWQELERIWAPYRRYPLYLTPGNHDIWSAASERLFQKYAGHPTHYSFDYGQAHFTILDNSRSEELAAGEIDYLEKDLKAHASAPVKLIFSHRPSWILNAALQNPDFPLHRLARQYGVRYVIAGQLRGTSEAFPGVRRRLVFRPRPGERERDRRRL